MKLTPALLLSAVHVGFIQLFVLRVDQDLKRQVREYEPAFFIVLPQIQQRHENDISKQISVKRSGYLLNAYLILTL